MVDDSEARDREARARLSTDIATMKRMSEGWQRLFGCVERGLPAASALRGFQLAIEAALGKFGAEAALSTIDELILGVAERNELARLQARVVELEGELTAEKRENELRTARIAELKELLEAERTPDEGKPAAETAAGAKRARRPSVPPPEKSGDPVEGWWATIVSFFSLYLYGYKLGVPRPAVTAEELARGRAEERELIYRPPEARVSYDELMAAHGFQDHSTLQPEDRSRIGFVPTGTGSGSKPEKSRLGAAKASRTS